MLIKIINKRDGAYTLLMRKHGHSLSLRDNWSSSSLPNFHDTVTINSNNQNVSQLLRLIQGSKMPEVQHIPCANNKNNRVALMPVLIQYFSQSFLIKYFISKLRI